MREYKIDLSDPKKALSWRRFNSLLRGLSSKSNWINLMSFEEKKLKDQKNGNVPIEDEKIAERAVNSVW